MKRKNMLKQYKLNNFDMDDKIDLKPYIRCDDPINPSYYKKDKVETIETIEDAVDRAPTPKMAVLHGQIVRYILRLWLKENALQDAKKAQWYLSRLIAKLEASNTPLKGNITY